MIGRLLVNGNMPSVPTFCERIRPWLFGRRPDPRVLVVTAAWEDGEYDESPVREALAEVGVRGGFDEKVRNLCAWHRWRDFLGAHAEVADAIGQIRSVAETTRHFYVERTAFHAQRVREALAFARGHGAGFALGELPELPRDSLRPEDSLDGPALLRHAVRRELLHELEDLRANDARMLAALEEIDGAVEARTGLLLHPDWRREREELEGRILAADAILVFGGNPIALLDALRFFDLAPALREALRRGSNLCTISAGSLSLCERVVIYDDRSPDVERREFRLLDRGLGLVGGLQAMPHCHDRIVMDDPDNLAYLARRFASHACVGLDEESFLEVDFVRGTATSVGRGDPVYMFGADGRKLVFREGEVLPVLA